MMKLNEFEFGFGRSRVARIIGRCEHPYLVRWTLFTVFGLSLKLHIFVGDDPEDLHDHPWAFFSLLLAGSYAEVTESGVTMRHAPSIVYRPAKWKHRVMSHPGAVSLVLSFPRVREWGFWPDGKWVKWSTYIDGFERDC